MTNLPIDGVLNSIDLYSVKEKLTAFAKKRGWEEFHSPKNLVMALGVECSELAEHFQWISEEASFRVCNKPEQREEIEDEVADVFLYLMQLMMKLDIDLEQVVKRKIEKNEKKYPLEKASMYNAGFLGDR